MFTSIMGHMFWESRRGEHVSIARVWAEAGHLPIKLDQWGQAFKLDSIRQGESGLMVRTSQG